VMIAPSCRTGVGKAGNPEAKFPTNVSGPPA
jgi:hypothetical protein